MVPQEPGALASLAHGLVQRGQETGGGGWGSPPAGGPHGQHGVVTAGSTVGHCREHGGGSLQAAGEGATQRARGATIGSMGATAGSMGVPHRQHRVVTAGSTDGHCREHEGPHREHGGPRSTKQGWGGGCFNTQPRRAGSTSVLTPKSTPDSSETQT